MLKRIASLALACGAFCSFAATAHGQISTTPAWIYEGDQIGGLLGFSVSTAGDVNGDGYSDVIVGERAYKNVEANEGRALVFLGSPSGLSASPAWTAEPNVAVALFGTIVSGGGDVNGDGFDDVIVGAPNLTNGESQEGRAYVYLGSASGLAASAAWSVESNQAFAHLGQSVGAGGDVNGDGYDDVIVGANEYDNGESQEGRAFVYLGSATGLDTVPAWTVENNIANSQLGRSVNMAGDVNGDGYGDVIVAWRLDLSNFRTSVYLGSASGLATTAVWTGTGGGNFGFTGRSAGDVNGDGYSDVIVGARSHTNPETNEGAAFVYLGSASGPSATPDWVVESNLGLANLGSSVSSAGDVNNDGYGDLIVGASGLSDGQTSEGGAFVYLGSASGPDTTAAWTAQSDSATAQFGFSVSAGDVNGDGFSDVVVGAYQFAGFGRAYVYHALAHLPDQPPIVSGPADEAVEAGAALSFTVTASDPDSDPIASLAADLSWLPPGNNATFVADGTNTSGVFTWNPSPAVTGTYAVAFIAGNAQADTLTTAIAVSPFGTTVQGVFEWTPAADHVGSHVVTFKGKSADGDSSSATTTIIVSDLPPGSSASPQLAPKARLATMKGPVVSAPTTVGATVGTTVVFDVYATGADSLSCDTTGLPAGNDASFTVDHEPVPVAPVIRGVDPGVVLTFAVTAFDPDGDALDTLAVDVSGLPPGNDASFVVNGTQTSGLFSWTPGTADTGNFVVNFKATNRLVKLATTVISVGQGLRRYWRLNGDATDEVTGEVLAPSGGVGYTTGQLQLAVDLDASTSGRLTGAASPHLDLTGAGFTFEAWVQVRSLGFGVDPRIAFAGHEGPPDLWELYVCDEGCTAGRARLRVASGGTVTELQSNAEVADAAWHHVAVTYDGADLKLYVDGVLDNVLPQPGLTTAVDGGLFVLGDTPSGGSQLDGRIDDVRIWSRVRTPAEIASDMGLESGYPTAVEHESPRRAFRLAQNRPNPFNPSTRIDFELAEPGRVRLSVFDVLGRHVGDLVDRVLPAGRHEVTWSGLNGTGLAVASGVYFYRLTANRFTETRKMVLLE